MSKKLIVLATDQIPDYVKDIQAVKQLNNLMRESKDLFEATDGFQTNITAQVAKASPAHQY